MNMIPLDSSNVKSAGYDDESKVLVVEFKGGARYQYDGVGRGEYEALVLSASPGGYIAKAIKPKYQSTRL